MTVGGAAKPPETPPGDEPGHRERGGPAAPATPARLRLLMAAMVAVAASTMVAAVPALAGSEVPVLWRVALVAVLFVLGDLCLVTVRFGHNHHAFTWAETAVVVGLVLLPSPWLQVVATAASLVTDRLARRPAVKTLFNAGSVAAATFLAQAAFDAAAGGSAAAARPRVWAALVLSSLAFFVWNGVTVSAAVALSQGLRLREVYLKAFLLNALVWAGNTGVGVLLVAMARFRGVLVVVPALVAMLYVVYRGYLRAMHERDTWQVLQSTSRDLLRTDSRDVAAVVLERTPELFQAEFVELLVLDDERGANATLFRWAGGADRTERRGHPDDLAPASWPRACGELETFQVAAAHAPAGQRHEMESLGLAACVVVPLVTQRGCLGLLRLGFRGQVELDRRELQVLTTFANHVGSALHNTCLIEEMRTQALHDPLTGLPNRSLLVDRLTQALRHLDRRPGAVAVLFCDLDRFKVVNDSLGHEAGDELLVEVARRIEGGLRQGDTATRFGGDEFVVVCEDVADEAAACHLAERLSTGLAAPFRLRGESIYLTASIGVAVTAGADDDPMALIRDADAAMYEAKGGGRARWAAFDNPMRLRAVARLENENDLRRAIERGELRLHYQPTISIPSGRTTGVEALVRWERPGRGLVSPVEFIPLAEETGLIVPLGQWVLQEACRQVAAWTAEGLVDHRFSVSVNLSPHQLSAPDVLDHVDGAIRRSGIASRQLCVEVTESALVDDSRGAAETLRRIHGLGARIAIDDFGTGYSALSYLHLLPVDVLKIDGSFVGRLGPDPRGGALITGLVDLAHALGLSVVAEGVETAQQLEELAGIGCDIAQGYLFARPQPAPAIAAFLRSEAGRPATTAS